MKRYDQDWGTGAGEYQAADGEWVRYDDARAVIDGLQALLNERDAEIDRLRGQVEDLGGYASIVMASAARSVQR